MGNKVNEPITREEIIAQLDSSNLYLVISVNEDGSGSCNTNMSTDALKGILDDVYKSLS